ncbi:oxidoreductase domain-containing protein [Aspergillus tamarii]|uniref:Oxidoreductase domain-containing protein n=1 Tax=Aspergillus tamarii TaxID=41984 RepID=A0A5N6UKE8_ASPTM|nr:oxidoreductase domain-containing protein [Aspergillus tamarii]
MGPQPDPNFLSPLAPPGAKCNQIDFATSDPPLPEYKNRFAVVIDNILTEEECSELIRLAEASSLTPQSTTPVWERAMINVGGGRQRLATDTRNCGRIIWDTPELADKLLNRLMPFLKELEIDRLENRPLVTGLAGRNKTYELTRLNERLRFLKYEGGEYFKPHWDAFYTTPDQKEKSYYTVHLYLNGDGEQDLKELREQTRLEKGNVNLDVGGKLLGGATSFLPRYEEKERQLRVFPKTGSVLVFQQNDLLHGGDSVFRGTKYTMRTDIMYQQL